MPKKAKKIVVFENPFSNDFLQHWNKWKFYKQELFKFKYKSFTSENAGLARLFRISGGSESYAEEIIEYSMSNEWEGLYTPKNQNNGTNTHRGAFNSGNSNGKPGTSEARTEGLANWGRKAVR